MSIALHVVLAAAGLAMLYKKFVSMLALSGF